MCGIASSPILEMKGMSTMFLFCATRGCQTCITLDTPPVEPPKAQPQSAGFPRLFSFPKHSHPINGTKHSVREKKGGIGNGSVAQLLHPIACGLLLMSSNYVNMTYRTSEFNLKASM